MPEEENGNGKEEMKTKLRGRVIVAANFIAPYFRIYSFNNHTNSRRMNNELSRLKIKTGEPLFFLEYPDKFAMALPEEATDSDIAHETGHFLHYFINPKGFRQHPCINFRCYIETIADYAEAIYLTKGKVVKEMLTKNINLKSPLSRFFDLPFLSDLPQRDLELDDLEKLCLAHRILGKYIQREKVN